MTILNDLSASPSRNLKLLAWNLTGQVVVKKKLSGRTIAMSNQDDADIKVPELEDAHVFARAKADGCDLVFQSQEELINIALQAGSPKAIGKLTWMLMDEGSERTASAAAPAKSMASQAELSPQSALLEAIIAWSSERTMSGTPELKAALREAMHVIVEHSRAVSAMLVLSEADSFSLIGHHGMSDQDAQTVWDKMPAGFIEDLLRQKARIVLPDSLRDRGPGNSETTVFIKDIRSLAGFPLITEGRVVGVLYVGFKNILTQLSSDLQAALEAACSIIALVVQRAMLREQMHAFKHGNSSLQNSEAPIAMRPGRLMLGASPQIMQVYELIERIAPVPVPTLINGETGTGKELAAREIHRLSDRSDKPLIVVNAVAIPESLIESELFGHKRGAFTGALTDRMGLIEQAAGGTLFIDEIGELSLPLQAKLLRVLQEKYVTRLGEAEPRPVDFRLVSATHRHLKDMVASGAFREDLYYRIAGVTIELPSLRARAGDTLLLANFFRQQFAHRHGLPEKEFSTGALAALEAHVWSGNVRELENVVARAFVMADGLVIKRDDLQLPVTLSGDDLSESGGSEYGESLADAKNRWLKTHIKDALIKHHGNRVKTAAALGIGQRTLFRYIEQLHIDGA